MYCKLLFKIISGLYHLKMWGKGEYLFRMMPQKLILVPSQYSFHTWSLCVWSSESHCLCRVLTLALANLCGKNSLAEGLLGITPVLTNCVWYWMFLFAVNRQIVRKWYVNNFSCGSKHRHFSPEAWGTAHDLILHVPNSITCYTKALVHRIPLFQSVIYNMHFRHGFEWIFSNQCSWLSADEWCMNVLL